MIEDTKKIFQGSNSNGRQKNSEEQISAKDEILSDKQLESVAGGTNTDPGEMFFLHDELNTSLINYGTQGGHGCSTQTPNKKSDVFNIFVVSKNTGSGSC